MRCLIIAVVIFAPMLALAQESDDAAGRVTALARHISEMRDLLQTTDVTVRDAAIETALHDPSPAIRGMAIYYALRRYDHLPLDFALPAGSAIPATELPSLVLSRVEWSADGRSLKAFGAPCGGYVGDGRGHGGPLAPAFCANLHQQRGYWRGLEFNRVLGRARFHMCATRCLLPPRFATH